MKMQEQGALPTQEEPELYGLDGRSEQVLNNAGGYVYEVYDMKRLERFIIMGCESGSYTTRGGGTQLVRENIESLFRLIQDDLGESAVSLIKQVSLQRRNVKQNPLIFALAMCARSSDAKTKAAAYTVLNDVCRIPTHLFMFVKFCEQENDPESDPGGWGRRHKTAVQSWYKQFSRNPEKLARLVTKFKHREGWTHKDLLRLSHPNPHSTSLAIAYILRWIAKGRLEADNMYIAGNPELNQNSELARVARLIAATEDAQNCTDPDELCHMIQQHRLSWEHVPTRLLSHARVWKALLRHMPIEALIRNLGKMTNCGVFPENSEEEEIAIDKIRKINSETEPSEDNEDEDVLPQGRNIHPYKLLVTLVTYKQGRGDKGRIQWVPNTTIINALDSAFYQAFNNVQPTNKKFFLAVDVSDSMSQPVLGSSAISCAMAAATIMMAVARSETNYTMKGFSQELQDLDINPGDTLDEVMRKTQNVTFGPTDCSLPMKWAIEHGEKDIDVFVVYTDNETWFGNVHPTEALRGYREYAQKRAVKLIVCGMCSNNFNIADPEDAGTLDIAGFDPSVPQLIANFVTHH